MKTWLTILLPTYNGAQYLDRTLEAFLEEEMEGVEILAIDDGSTDETMSILRRFSSLLPLRPMEVSHSGSWMRGANLALGEARGEYASLLSHDDVWTRGSISVVRSALRRHPEAGVLFHPSRFIDARGRVVGRWRCPLRGPRLLGPEEILPRLLVQCFVAAVAVVFRREPALQRGGFDESKWFAADWELWLALASRFPTLYLPEFLTEFRIHLGSQSLMRGTVTEIRQQFDSVVDKYAPIVGDDDIERIARFSVRFNAVLLSLYRGERSPVAGLVCEFLRLGPTGVWKYFFYSRIVERVLARLSIMRTSGMYRIQRPPRSSKSRSLARISSK